MNEDELEKNTCESLYDPPVGAHIGVEITHKPSNITVRNIDKRTQFANKVEAIEKLKFELLALNCSNSD
ncbi:peptide chain release factor family protein [Flavobacterium sp. W21_SRS_FM6]|uniref:peptide chain release factor family protein n=1 Tax=Flavobacterium sp. W21_SRS_FM6 TaxID=3240268 RepID=UPI003F8D9EB6